MNLVSIFLVGLYMGEGLHFCRAKPYEMGINPGCGGEKQQMGRILVGKLMTSKGPRRGDLSWQQIETVQDCYEDQVFS
jgi:hypothetical protein